MHVSNSIQSQHKPHLLPVFVLWCEFHSTLITRRRTRVDVRGGEAKYTFDKKFMEQHQVHCGEVKPDMKTQRLNRKEFL